MTKEDYVSYPVALALKKAGFDWKCEAFYEHIDGKMWLSVDGKEDWNSGVDYSAVLLWQAQKWLRKVHKIDMNIDLDDETDDPYTVEIYKNRECIVGHWELGFYTSYEQALSTGIAKVLELIKKGE